MNETLLTEVKPSFVILIPHLLLICLFIGLITIWKPLFALISTHLRVTNKRVQGQTGMLKTQSLDCPINQITSVNVNQGILGKILNYGDITISSANGTIALSYMPNPNQIKDIIMQNNN